MLKIDSIEVGYGHLQIIWGVSFEIAEGEIVAVLGTNGAGKTTMLKSIAGIQPVQQGTITFNKENITNMPPHQITRKKLAFVPEERNLFPAMTVEENLLMGAYTIHDKQKIQDNLTYVYDMFPRLVERKKQLAGTMSGGERQMLAIARGLMSNPRMVILDEPSIGLSPENVLVVFETIHTLRKEKVTVLIAEQNVETTLCYSDRAYVIEHGKIAMQGTSNDLMSDGHIQKMYLGQM